MDEIIFRRRRTSGALERPNTIMSRIFALLLFTLTVGCATYNYEVDKNTDKCCVDISQEKDWYYYIHEQNSIRDWGNTYVEVKKALSEKKFKEIQIDKEKVNYEKLCQQYRNFMIVSVKYLAPYDAGQELFTGLSCGLIPTWSSMRSWQQYDFDTFENCEATKHYSFVVYQNSFNWIFALPFSQLPAYKESGTNVGKSIMADVFGSANN